MMIVISPKFSPNHVRPTSTADDRASAVTMPGNAIGSTSTNEMASRPKNRNRCTAKDANVPRKSAMHVAETPALIELKNAGLSSGFCHATANHLVVKRRGGQAALMFLLKA